MPDFPSLIARVLYSPLIGLFLLAGAAYMVVEQQQFVSSASVAEGEIIELVRTTNRNNERVDLPRVSYVDAAGQEQIFLHTSSGFWYHKGQTVRVYYSQDGTDERVGDLASMWGIPVLISLMGVVFTGFGFMLSRARRKE